MTVKEQYDIVVAAINHGDLDEAWDLIGQFEELFIFSHRDLCNNLSAKATAIDPMFIGV